MSRDSKAQGGDRGRPGGHASSGRPRGAASPAPSGAAPAWERILVAATELFMARGYHGTSMRQLAHAVGIEAASLYHHFPSKQEILLGLFERTMVELLDGLGEAIASGDTAEAKLRAVVRFHVLFHIARQGDAFVSHSELRSLSPQNRERVVARRDGYERTLRDLLRSGVDTGEFRIEDVSLTSTAILMMCSGVSDWFVADGRLRPEEVASRYEDMVMRLVRG